MKRKVEINIGVEVMIRAFDTEYTYCVLIYQTIYGSEYDVYEADVLFPVATH